MRTRLFAIFLLSGLALTAQTIDPPAVKTQVEPLYPDDLKFYITDHPEVKLTIDERGEPFAIESPVRIPDNVVKAIRQSRFEPAHQGKRPVAVTISLMMPIRRPLSDAQSLTRTSTSTSEINDAGKTAKALDDAGEAEIERRIAQNPGDVQSRLVAIYYRRLHDSPGEESASLKQLRWFAENSPRYEFLGMPGASPRREEKGSEDYEALRKLWIGKLAGNPDQTILDNATNFLRITDPEAAEAALLKAAGSTDHAMNLLGDLYAFAGMGVTAVDPFLNMPADRSEQLASTPFAVQAREKVLKTNNLRLLFSVLHTVSGAGDPAFCNALLDRAKQFYPDATANCGATVTKRSTGSVRAGGAVIAANLIKPVRPEYPPEAKNRGVHGTVKFAAIIGKDGKIRDLELLSGPFLLYDSARKAVEQWEYRPTILNGEPVDVQTTIDVNFTLQ